MVAGGAIICGKHHGQHAVASILPILDGPVYLSILQGAAQRTEGGAYARARARCGSPSFIIVYKLRMVARIADDKKNHTLSQKVKTFH